MEETKEKIMLIAHLPAGYLLTKALQRKLDIKTYLWVGLLGSIFPDLDILYFYFVDNKQTLHHAYWFHVPLFWGSVLAVFSIIGFFIRKKTYWFITILFFSGVFLHLCLDSIIEHGIKWLYPFSDLSVYFISIPAKFDWWVWSFVFHPSFLLELGIMGWACLVFLKNRK